MGDIYRHYKGGLYELLAEGKNEATLTDVVIYRSCQKGDVWVRPKEEFFDGRFEKVGDEYYQKPFDPIKDIQLFHSKFGIDYKGPPRMLPEDLFQFRLKFLGEELAEWALHHQHMHSILTQDPVPDQAELTHHLAEQLDAMVDLAYVLFGTVHLHGLDHVFVEAWHRVQRANMAKVLAQSAADSKRGYAQDVVKPAGWEPPDHSDLVEVNWVTVRKHED
jgi:predicted HAD superfamily Cof-like phosphohydrolase